MNRQDGIMGEQYPARVYAKINLGAVTHNFDRMRACLKSGTRICAVIKADGYGHGAVPIAKRIEGNEDIWGFAVATAGEAVTLRENGITKPILILGYVFPEDYPDLVKYEIRPTIFTQEAAEQFAQAVRQSGRSSAFPVHFAVDTGMSRIGFPDTEAGADEAAGAAALPELFVEGLFTHFARADEKDKTTAEEAFARYTAFTKLLEKRGVFIPMHHASNSAAILELPEAHLDMVRAGITIYGIYPSDEMVRDKDLWPVMELHARISHIKEVSEDTPVSYGGTYVTKRPSRIATIPVGYADGYPRSLSSRGSVLINGKRAPILGRVCMDQFMVDVTDIPADVGDKATLLGKNGSEEITIDELSALSGRFPYEFVCDIGKRVPRVFVDE